MNILPKEFARLPRKKKVTTIVLAAVATGGVLLVLDRFIRSSPRAYVNRYATAGTWTDMAQKLGITIGADLDTKSAQRYLNQISNAGLQENGVLDTATSNALRKFQRGNGIQETGVIDEETGNALQYFAAATSKSPQLQQAVTLPPQPVTYTPAPPPSAGRPWADAVKKDPRLGPPFTDSSPMSAHGARRALNDLMHLGLPVAGALDTALQSALHTFQQAQGLPLTGQLDSETSNALLYLATAAATAHTTFRNVAQPPMTAGYYAGLQSTTMYDPTNYYGDPKPYWPATNVPDDLVGPSYG